MVVTRANKQSDTGVDNTFNTLITLRPNRSATWRQTKWVIAIMVAVVMIIAVAWTFIGAWIVLPFAGLEVGLFAFLMYKVSRFTYSKQVISITPHQVTVEFGYREVERLAAFTRTDLNVYYTQTENNWELPKIALNDGQQLCVIGDFLNLEDRVILKQSLEDAGLIICKNHWWEK